MVWGRVGDVEDRQVMTKDELVEAQVEAARRIARERRPRETARALFVAFVVIPVSVLVILVLLTAAMHLFP